MLKRKIRHITSFQIIILGFMSIIILGSILLMLPIATVDGKGAGFIDALFTSTSAVCVTGLVVQNTATYWTVFGQGVIIALIQIGGMGVITVAIFLAVLSGKKIGLMQRNTMQEAISAHKMGGIVKFTKFIVITSLSIELIGAALLSLTFCREYGFFKGIWYSLFHSISAFCNAGFDILAVKEPYSSLTEYSADPIVNIVIMLLIIIGGISFMTWDDVKNNKWRLRKYRMQSKAILTVTAALIILPAIYYFFFEFSDYPLGERILVSFFQTVTPRTAGFNTADLTKISESGQMIMIALMLIGGSPGSTAGGMKTTTIAILVSSAVSVFFRKENSDMFKRRVPEEAVKKAATVFLIYLVLCVGGGMIISSIENVPLISAMFETASAIGTVGLTLGITPQLGVVSHLILITLMFCGRVGGLTLIFAAMRSNTANVTKYPQEKIMVG